MFVTPEMNKFTDSLNTVLTMKFYAAYLLSNVLLAPLQTVITSLQLSVKKHKDIFTTE